MLIGTIQIIHSEDEFERWLTRAVTGEFAEYHRGFLAVDRDPSTSPLEEPEVAACAARGERAASAAELQLVHLFQRRLGTGDFSYIAVRRGRRVPGDCRAQERKRRWS